MKARMFRVCLWGMLLLTSATFSSDRTAKPDARSVTSLGSQVLDDSTYINANNILMVVSNDGVFARDRANVLAAYVGMLCPWVSLNDVLNGFTTDYYLLNAGGAWLGGKVNGELRLAIADYGSEYVPGPMASGTFIPDNPAFHVYKLYADSLADNPNLDYLSWPVTQGAPVDDRAHPLMKGDQMLWTVFNDADSAAHTAYIGSTKPLGVEIRQTVWASFEDGSDTLPGVRNVAVNQAGSTNVVVSVDIVDRSLMTGHSYRVVIDTSGSPTWDLEDLTAGTTVLANQTNFEGDSTSPVVDGVRVRVLKRRGLADWQWTGSERPLTGVDWGGSGFFGGIGVLDEFFVSDLPRSAVRWVEIRWVGDGNGQDAYLYNRSDAYSYEGFFPQDLEVWDVTPGLLERQINFAFVENDWAYPHTPPDSLWDPGVQFDDYPTNLIHDGVGGREYFQIMTSDYSDTALSDYTVDQWFNGTGGSVWDVLYGGWLKYRTGDGKPDSGDVFLLIPQDPTFVPDTFTFTATKPAIITSGPDGVSLYMEYRIYNKGTNVIDSCYFSIWTDGDVGNPGDDKFGCDTLSNVFFGYNADSIDAAYGNKVPAVGFKFLSGPLVPAPGETAYFGANPVADRKNLGMTAFWAIAQGTLSYPYQSYYYMQGLNFNGKPYTYLGDTITYTYSGDPVTGVGDLDPYAYDKRAMGSTGPFTLNPGDSQFVLLKLAVGFGDDNLSSITRMREILNLPFEYPTAVEQISDADLPRTFRLGQNYPNPFNPTTVIEFSVPERADVKLDIYNILGRKVKTLVDREMAAGDYTVQWDGTNQSGHSVATGIYLYRLTAGDHAASRKMLLLK